ncbi:ABC transporter ATP-binding protein [Pseudomonas sp. TE24901]
MIEISNLTKTLGMKRAISDLSFCIEHQECVGLLGSSGAGKTTLLNLMAGVMKPTTGHIKIERFNIGSHPVQAKKQIGYQLDKGLCHCTLSVNGFLNFIASVHGFRGAEHRRRVDMAASRLALWPVFDYPINTLSFGLKRKVAIAQAILHDPRVLLLDEPTAGLTPTQQLKLMTLIRSLAEEMAVIVTSRHGDELANLCTRALVLADGHLVADAPLAQLQRNSRHSQAITLACDTPLDLLALAVLPGVAGIEENRLAPGTVTVLAMPGHAIYPPINALIASRGWNITAVSLEPGRLSDVVNHLSQGSPL